MFKVLVEMEKHLPALLRDTSGWNSDFVDYHEPFVERLWRQEGEYRLYLHRIHPCEPSQALFHPHPWPSAMRIIGGEYEMGVGYGKGTNVPPAAATLILPNRSSYEMVDPDGWHYVRPLGKPTLSFMVTGVPWNRESPKSSKPLSPLSGKVIDELFGLFRDYYVK